MLNKDSLPIGLILGIVTPFVGYAVWMMLFEQMDSMGWLDNSGFSENWRNRTIALLAICMNIIPFSIYNRKRFYNSMRGFVFPTLILAVIWFFTYGKHLL